MALPLDPTTPGNLSSPGLGDDEIRALKAWLVAVFGVPVSPSAVGAPAMSISTAGVITFSLPPVGTVNEINVQTFTAVSGTWTKPADLRLVDAYVQGGGGGGGSPGLAGVGATRAGGGGSGGGFSRKLINAALLNATEGISVGPGGLGATGGAAGNIGGQSSFGAHCIATGGGGGSFGTSDNLPGPGQDNGGIGSFGHINLRGGAGHHGLAAPGWAVGGNGGTSFFGGGGLGAFSGIFVGQDGTFYGGGGGGGFSSSSAVFAGGNGAQGIVIVVEYKS